MSSGNGRVPSRVTVHGFAADGSDVSLSMEAAHEGDAARAASLRGITVTSVQVATPGRGRRRPAAFPLMQFSQELLALLDSGLNLTEALSTLIAKERHAPTLAELTRILQSLKQGQNLSDVLSAAPGCFPDVYVATIRASERTGNLSKALGRYIAYQAQFEAIRKMLVSAAIYPVALLVIGALVALFLLGYVVPRFSVVYDASGRDIPALSQAMLHAGRFIHAHWLWVGIATVCLLALGALSLRQASVRRAVLEGFLGLPCLAQKSNEFRLGRFYRAVSLLLASGIPLSKALGMVRGLLSSAQQTSLAAVELAIHQGRSLSSALLAAGLASPVAESLIKVGERSGQMAEMLERTAKFHDDDFARWIEWASRLLEPILMALIGAVIGGVVILMYMPIFELAGTLQ